MLLAPDSEDQEPQHPYLYAKVLAIFHANVICTGTAVTQEAQRMNFLWVRWYTYHPNTNPNRLPRLSFPPLEEGATGFVDPADVLRGCHIVPAFSQGKCSPDGTHTSKLAKDGDDWNAYYVNS